MKLIKVFASLMLVFVLCSAFTQEKKGKGVYIAGVSASFTDSLIYFTDIQFVDSVVIGRDGLLPGRDDYSDQLEAYLLEVKGSANRVCFIYFNKNKAKVQKTLSTMKDKYKKDGKSVLHEVGDSFKFTKPTENQ